MDIAKLTTTHSSDNFFDIDRLIQMQWKFVLLTVSI